MNFNKVIMGVGIVILIGAGTYSVGNLYYFGPKKYHEKIEECDADWRAGKITAAEMREQVEECGNSIYPKSLAGLWIAAGGMLMFVYGRVRQEKQKKRI